MDSNFHPIPLYTFICLSEAQGIGHNATQEASLNQTAMHCRRCGKMQNSQHVIHVYRYIDTQNHTQIDRSVDRKIRQFDRQTVDQIDSQIQRQIRQIDGQIDKQVYIYIHRFLDTVARQKDWVDRMDIQIDRWIGQGRVGKGRTGQERIGEDRVEQDRAGQARQDRTGKLRKGQID